MIYVDSKLPVFEAWSSSVFHKYTKNGAGFFFAVVNIGHVIAYVYIVAQYPSFFIACAHSAVGCATRLTGLCSVCCMCSCVVGVVMWRWEMAFIGHVTDFPLLFGLTAKTDHRMIMACPPWIWSLCLRIICLWPGPVTNNNLSLYLVK